MRVVRRTFTGPADFLADPDNRLRFDEYLTDMARPYALQVQGGPALGQSYGEMARALIESAALPDEPVDLLILAFSVHDVRPGRQTAAYLSHVTPGAPMAFAICDQGSAAAFSGLRIAGEYVSSAGIDRALVIVVEQAALPYGCPVPLPSEHRGVAMLYSATPDRDGAKPQARVAGVRQHPCVPPGGVADLAAADVAELACGYDGVGLVLSDALGAVWAAPAAGRVRVMPAGQPSTEVWWGLIDEFANEAGQPELVVAADYDPGLRYLSLTAFDTWPR